METGLEYILMLAALATSIASITISVLLYTNIKRSLSTPVQRDRDMNHRKPERSRKYIKRYLLFRIYRIKGEAGFEDLESCFKNSVTELLGVIENPDRGLKLVRYNAESGVGIVRIISSDIHKVIFAISRLRRCGNSVVIVMPTLIAGTLKKAISKVHEYEGRYK